MKFQKAVAATILSTVGVTVASSSALAYAGPGAGISAIGTVFSILGAFVLALVGFIWYPIKRVLKRFRSLSPKVPSAVPKDR